MAFMKEHMFPVSGFGSVGPRIWSHIQPTGSDQDSSTVQNGANYFNDALEDFDIQAGDFIWAGENDPTASNTQFFGITSVIGGVVLVNGITPV